MKMFLSVVGLLLSLLFFVCIVRGCIEHQKKEKQRVEREQRRFAYQQNETDIDDDNDHSAGGQPDYVGFEVASGRDEDPSLLFGDRRGDVSRYDYDSKTEL